MYLFVVLLNGMIQVVEITKGSKVKYELDKKTGLIKVLINSSSQMEDFCANMKSMFFRLCVEWILVLLNEECKILGRLFELYFYWGRILVLAFCYLVLLSYHQHKFSG